MFSTIYLSFIICYILAVEVQLHNCILALLMFITVILQFGHIIVNKDIPNLQFSIRCSLMTIMSATISVLGTAYGDFIPQKYGIYMFVVDIILIPFYAII